MLIAVITLTVLFIIYKNKSGSFCRLYLSSVIQLLPQRCLTRNDVNILEMPGLGGDRLSVVDGTSENDVTGYKTKISTKRSTTRSQIDYG